MCVKNVDRKVKILAAHATKSVRVAHVHSNVKNNYFFNWTIWKFQIQNEEIFQKILYFIPLKSVMFNMTHVSIQYFSIYTEVG